MTRKVYPPIDENMPRHQVRFHVSKSKELLEDPATLKEWLGEKASLLNLAKLKLPVKVNKQNADQLLKEFLYEKGTVQNVMFAGGKLSFTLYGKHAQDSATRVGNSYELELPNWVQSFLSSGELPK